MHNRSVPSRYRLEQQQQQQQQQQQFCSSRLGGNGRSDSPFVVNYYPLIPKSFLEIGQPTDVNNVDLTRIAKRAYRRLSIKYHSEVYGGKLVQREQEIHFQLVAQAYEALVNNNALLRFYWYSLCLLKLNDEDDCNRGKERLV